MRTPGHRSEPEEVFSDDLSGDHRGNARFDGGSSLKTWMFAVIHNQASSRSLRVLYALRSLTRIAAFASLQEMGDAVPGIGLGTARIHCERGKATLRRQLAPLERAE